MPALTPGQAVAGIKSGQRVFVHGAAATPFALLRALGERAHELRNVELIHLHTEGEPLSLRHKENFKTAGLFIGRNLRGHVDGQSVDYLPVFLSEIPSLFRSRRRPLDVALLHLSPPDRHGYCSLGTSVDVAKAAFDSAPVVIAQINAQMPRVHGDGFIHIEDLDAYCQADEPLPLLSRRQPTEVETAIGRHVAALVEDGACLQIGIGAIPDAVLAALHGHRHLGVHTETWSDGLLDLIRAGAVDGSRKRVHAGKILSSFIEGSEELYNFVADNPEVVQYGVDYVNSPAIIARNTKVTAINSAIEVDLTGQVCADSIGHKLISGVGGQVDFLRGAALSEGGKPILALTSRTKQGWSRIVVELKPGAGVVTTRAHVHYVVTEYGAVNLHGMTLSERAKALINIAHPDDREDLARRWFALS